jgi:hypothetical protein
MANFNTCCFSLNKSQPTVKTSGPIREPNKHNDSFYPTNQTAETYFLLLLLVKKPPSLQNLDYSIYHLVKNHDILKNKIIYSERPANTSLS